MGESKKELFSDKVIAGSRTYYFDLKESVQGAKYLVISESKENEQRSFDHHRVMVFEEHLLDFYKSFRNAISYFVKHDDFPLIEEQIIEEKETYSVDSIRTSHPKAYSKWTNDEDDLLARLHSEGKSITEIAERLQRQQGAIRSRLQKIGLL